MTHRIQESGILEKQLELNLQDQGTDFHPTMYKFCKFEEANWPTQVSSLVLEGQWYLHNRGINTKFDEITK